MGEQPDPRETGKAPWFEEARKVSQHWADGLELSVGGIDLPQTMAYPMLEAINRYFLDEVARRAKEPQP
jgi:hypothetical protein